MINKIKLSIVILNFNTFELTKNCITSVLGSLKSKNDWEIIVVDNGSTDNSGDLLERSFINNKHKNAIKIIKLEENIGFSRGNNIGITKSTGDYVLLLNSDTEVQNEAIDIALEGFKDAKVGAVGCKLILPNGKIDPACHRGFPTPWASLTYYLGLERIFPKSKIFGQYHLGYLSIDHDHEVDAISGAFFLVRRKALDQVGLLDEDFFMYGEDLDLAFRIKKEGFKILFSPKAKVVHFKKSSGLKNKDLDVQKKIKYHFYNSMRIFYKKHYTKQYSNLLTRMIQFILSVRIALINYFSI